MLRGIVTSVAHSGPVRAVATGPLGTRVSRRFVAGRTLDEAVRVTRTLNEDGFLVSLDHLGENVRDASQVAAAGAMYLETLRRIGHEGLQANISVKLSQLGIALDPSLAYATVEQVVARAAGIGSTVTLDMEDHTATDATIDACLRLSGAHPRAVGVAIQAYLKRTPADLRRLGSAPVEIRLCKGAYSEPRSIAFRSRARVRAAFTDLTVALLSSSEAYPMIATHDEVLIDHAKAEAARVGRAPDTFEFQMLYGVRREMQRALLEQGYRVRIYVPFGDQWYPYLTRRIAERPANVRFFVEALLRR